jgi:hypothetical protein
MNLNHGNRPMNFNLTRLVSSALVALSVTGCGPEGTHHFPTESLQKLQMTKFAGDNQTVVVDYFADFGLTVLVIDANGPVPGFRIDWRVAVGNGSIATLPDYQPLTSGYTLTNANGMAQIVLKPGTIGTNVVVATAPALAGDSVIFTTKVTTPGQIDPLPPLVEFGPLFDCPEAVQFKPKNGTLELGSSIEWQFMDWVASGCRAELKSISAPPGGQPFDSGLLAPGQKFRFVPNATGKWEYIDAVSGGRGSFTVIKI